MGRVTALPGTLALAAGVALTATVSVLYLAVQAPEPANVERDGFSLFPRDIGEWSSIRTQLEPEIEAVLAADDYINATFRDPDTGAAVNLFSAFYFKQTEGSGIHSPEVCLPAGGWEIFALDADHAVSFPETEFGTFEVNRAIIQKGLDKQLVYYWFEQRGTRYTNDFSAKLGVVWDAFTIGRTDGALVRYVTPIGRNEDPTAADARILALMERTLPRLPRFIPGVQTAAE